MVKWARVRNVNKENIPETMRVCGLTSLKLIQLCDVIGTYEVYHEERYLCDFEKSYGS